MRHSQHVLIVWHRIRKRGNDYFANELGLVQREIDDNNYARVIFDTISLQHTTEKERRVNICVSSREVSTLHFNDHLQSLQVSFKNIIESNIFTCSGKELLPIQLDDVYVSVYVILWTISEVSSWVSVCICPTLLSIQFQSQEKKKNVFDAQQQNVVLSHRSAPTDALCEKRL